MVESSLGSTGVIHVWDRGRSKADSVSLLRRQYSAIQFSPDGRLLLAASLAACPGLADRWPGPLSPGSITSTADVRTC
ncbi:MAG: hypothetical protein WKF75_18180 [Singulisphaera sp.]